MSKSLFPPPSSSLMILKEQFEASLIESIPHLGDATPLRDACAYTLLSGGKRIRPLIVMLVAQALDHSLNVVHPALSVEYFHAASLIADDLPCMDDDDYRRSQPALHKRCGQATALLASYTLIAAGYKKIFQAGETLALEKPPFNARAHQTCVLALDAATRCAGISGATGGQFQDLYPQEKTIEQAFDTICKKTVSLFEVSFVFGWLFGGGGVDGLEQMRTVAYHFGLAFQIADDLDDAAQDRPSSLNVAYLIGKREAERRLKEEIEACACQMKMLGLYTPEFQEMLGRFNRIE